MSRSYKKFPLFRDVLWGKSMKKGRQYSNRKIRRKLRDSNIDVGNGRDYKRFGLNTWDLWEYKSLITKQDAIERYEKEQLEYENGVRSKKLKFEWSLADELNSWAKFHKRK